MQYQGFISFSAVASTDSVSPNSLPSENTNNNTPLYMGTDPELSTISKKLAKKNAVTILKAFSELESVLNNATRHHLVADFAPYFVFLYHRLILENQRNIRERLNIILEKLLIIDKISFGPHRKRLMGPWWMAMSDPCAEVSQAAQSAFNIAVPENKKVEVLSNQSSNILRYINDNLQSKVETMSDLSSCTQEEAEERFERVIVSSLNGLSRFISELPVEVNNKLLSTTGDNDNGSCDSKNDVVTYKDVIGDSFWKKTGSKRKLIRRATYEILISVCSNMPQIIGLYIDKLRLVTIICNMLDESDENNISIMLFAFVSFFKTYSDYWQYVDFNKMFNNRIHKLISNHLHDTCSILLPLLSSMSIQYLYSHFSSIDNIIDKVIQATTNQNNILPVNTKTIAGANRNTVVNNNEGNYLLLSEILTYLTVVLSSQEDGSNQKDLNTQNNINKLISKLTNVLSKVFSKMSQNNIEAKSTLTKLFRALYKTSLKSHRASSTVTPFWSCFSMSIRDALTEIELDDSDGAVYTSSSGKISYIQFLFDVLREINSSQFDEENVGYTGLINDLNSHANEILSKSSGDIPFPLLVTSIEIIIQTAITNASSSAYDARVTEQLLSFYEICDWHHKYICTMMNPECTTQLFNSLLNTIVKFYSIIARFQNVSSFSENNGSLTSKYCNVVVSVMWDCIQAKALDLFSHCLSFGFMNIYKDYVKSDVSNNNTKDRVYTWMQCCLNIVCNRRIFDCDNETLSDIIHLANETLLNASLESVIQFGVLSLQISQDGEIFKQVDLKGHFETASLTDSKNALCSFILLNYFYLLHNSPKEIFMEENTKLKRVSLISNIFQFAGKEQPITITKGKHSSVISVMSTWELVVSKVVSKFDVEISRKIMCEIANSLREKFESYLNNISIDSDNNNHNTIICSDKNMEHSEHFTEKEWSILTFTFLRDVSNKIYGDNICVSDVMIELGFSQHSMWKSLYESGVQMISDSINSRKFHITSACLNYLVKISEIIHNAFELDVLWSQNSDITARKEKNNILSWCFPVTNDSSYCLIIIQCLLVANILLDKCESSHCGASISKVLSVVRKDMNDAMECFQALFSAGRNACEAPDKSHYSHLSLLQSAICHTYSEFDDYCQSNKSSTDQQLADKQFHIACLLDTLKHLISLIFSAQSEDTISINLEGRYFELLLSILSLSCIKLIII
jgi:hypothetical protein